ncbi:hypothetical protein GR925_16210 [Streptomyces sp. HUCO-GS316]|uniref:hypothetical protein n=1 Tax=Streptomyces sp. HUCO-GS316 TaxID=2692198 RepID=UPI00136F69F5|nr:hypothetical protein [Streptomyces sp. HUCO-GS316]MXM64939.1 hypothetical protein [Streptomyces sp. HUCO-GS316]
MSTDRNTPEADGPTDLDDAWALERTAERIGEALRRRPVDDAAEQAAVAAFRSARAAGGRAPRTRRGDDWRPRTQRHRWVRSGAVALVTSALLGGIAFASIRVADTQRHDTADPGTGHSTRRPPADPPGEQSPPAGPGTGPATPRQRPGTAKDVAAHCRAYEHIKDQGHALKSTAWQRLVRAAGGEQRVPVYCARFTGTAAEATASPAGTNGNENGNSGQGQGRPTQGHAQPTAKARPSTGS